MDNVLEFLQNGITVNIAFDVESAIILGCVIFFAGVLVLLVYAKVILS